MRQQIGRRLIRVRVSGEGVLVLVLVVSPGWSARSHSAVLVSLLSL
jgi:hypothetical protein